MEGRLGPRSAARDKSRYGDAGLSRPAVTLGDDSARLPLPTVNKHSYTVGEGSTQRPPSLKAGNPGRNPTHPLPPAHIRSSGQLHPVHFVHGAVGFKKKKKKKLKKKKKILI